MLVHNRSLSLMASNKGGRSANSKKQNTENENLATTSNAAASIPAARPEVETTIETEPQTLHTAVPTGKRRRTSSANDNRIDSSGPVASSQSDIAAANAVQIQRSTHPVNSTLTTHRFPVANYDSDH